MARKILAEYCKDVVLVVVVFLSKMLSVRSIRAFPSVQKTSRAPRHRRPAFFGAEGDVAFPGGSRADAAPEERVAPASASAFDRLKAVFGVGVEAPSPVVTPEAVSYPDFLEELRRGDIAHAVVSERGNAVAAITRHGAEQRIVVPENTELIDLLAGHKIPVTMTPAPTPTAGAMIARAAGNFLTFVAEIGVMYTIAALIFRLVTGGRGGAGGAFGGAFGNSGIGGDGDVPPAEEKTGVTFDRVAGAENAKQDLAEIVDFLKRPEKYARVGARVPKGVLLSGPPGCGKTLLARAVAGEAGVPFFHTSGSEFIQLFVGAGAAKVRELFTKAKEAAPSIIFIDEIDAVGRARSGNASGNTGANDERDQTLNQLLTAMDGFENDTGVIVIAATNRPDILDDALTRPGRFDRRVTVELPDFRGRTEILGVHTSTKPLADDVSLDAYARITVGFSGADLENLANEAAIYAAREDAETIARVHFDAALEKIILGEARRTLILTEQKKRVIAFHEAGHALMGIIVSDYDLVRKISILPRGRTGGATYFEPSEDRLDMSLVTRTYLENKIMVALGGRIAEEIVFGTMNATTGAGGDLVEVYRVAYQMVADFGFNEKIGRVAWTPAIGGPGGLNGSAAGPDSEIGSEIRFIVKQLYDRASQMLNGQQFYLHRIAEELIQKETLVTEDLLRLTAGLTCRYRGGYASYDETTEAPNTDANNAA